MLRLAVAFLIFLVFQGTALAQAERWEAHGAAWRNGCSGARCFITFRYAHDQRPTGPFEKIGECANEATCKKFMIAAIQAAGSPEVTARSLVEGVGLAARSLRQKGEEMRGIYRVSSGYQLCNVRWVVYSKTKQTALGIRIYRDRLESYSYARKNNLGGRGEWVKVFIEVTIATQNAFPKLLSEGQCVDSARYGGSFSLYSQHNYHHLRGNAITGRVIDYR